MGLVCQHQNTGKTGFCGFCYLDKGDTRVIVAIGWWDYFQVICLLVELEQSKDLQNSVQGLPVAPVKW